MLRVAIVQFAPKLGKVAENIETATRLCSRLKPGSIDLLCLPEMVFTGYVFRSAAAISPFLEQPHTGPTSRFCSELAGRLRCYVAAGYPERLEEQTATKQEHPPSDSASSKVGANSSVIYGPDGDWVGGYRKTHLYTEDLPWAVPGNGFAIFHLPDPIGILSLGICMDLNPTTASWSLEDGPYELAQHCIETKTRTLLLLNAWLDSNKDSENEIDYGTLNYWATRLRPLWNGQSLSGTVSEADEHQTTVVICNRSGQEDGVTFAGSSALFRMNSSVGRPVLVGSYGRNDETVQVWCS